MRRLCRTLAVCLIAGLIAATAHGQYDPPANYYTTATGTDAVLKSQLRTIISAMTPVTYGDARFSAPYTDPDPNAAGKILLIYDRASVSQVWDPNALPWNREHIWPVSRLGVSNPDNGTTGIATDQFNLRPADTDLNAFRGNSPFGMDSTTGNYGYQVAGYFYPGNADAGDVARAQFYMATRYSQLALVEGSPSGTQMGDLSSLIHYHFRDAPDAFERRRNHAIYGLAGENSPAISNPYDQNNRNPYIDRPEFVWSVFVDQANDSQVRLQGGNVDAQGVSALNIDFGRRLVGAPAPSHSFVLEKAGDDGTYFQVTTTGEATSTVSGRHNAFRNGGADARTYGVSLPNTSTPGAKHGAVTFNNLDITTGGGADRGANDGDDVINLSMDVVAHANPSFSATSDDNSLVYDFGTVIQGSAAPTFTFDIFNFPTTLGYTAGLDLDLVSTVLGSPITTNVSVFNGANTLSAGAGRQFTATFDTSTPGAFETDAILNFSDEDLPGADSLGSMSITLSGVVEALTAAENADFDGDGDVDGADFLAWQSGLGMPSAAPVDGDANGDERVDAEDLAVWTAQFGRTAAPPSVNVPEPASGQLAVAVSLAIAVAAGMTLRQRRVLAI